MKAQLSRANCHIIPTFSRGSETAQPGFGSGSVNRDNLAVHWALFFIRNTP